VKAGVRYRIEQTVAASIRPFNFDGRNRCVAVNCNGPGFPNVDKQKRRPLIRPCASPCPISKAYGRGGNLGGHHRFVNISYYRGCPSRTGNPGFSSTRELSRNVEAALRGLSAPNTNSPPGNGNGVHLDPASNGSRRPAIYPLHTMAASRKTDESPPTSMLNFAGRTNSPNIFWDRSCPWASRVLRPVSVSTKENQRTASGSF